MSPFVKKVKLWTKGTNVINAKVILNVKRLCSSLIGCDPLNGHCRVPGECRCRIGLNIFNFLLRSCWWRLHFFPDYIWAGFAGEHCRDCALLPGCVHGTCNKSFECVCKPGWTGLFCSQGTSNGYSVKNQQVAANRKLFHFLFSFLKTKLVQ